MEKDIEALVKKMNGDIAAYPHFMCWMMSMSEDFK